MSQSSGLQLQDGAEVAVIGGGPAGSFFSYFFLEMAQTVGLDVHLDLYEPRDFSHPGPGGCNMCGGIISESLVQNLATEGIQLGPKIVQRTIDSYALHMDVGDVRIETPLQEKRIAAVHRGGGPRGIKEQKFGGLDGYLLDMAQQQGARWIRARVDKFAWDEGRPQVSAQGATKTYDFVAVAVGVNSASAKMFENAGLEYKAPKSTKTYICEFLFTRDVIRRELGYSMHVFLLNIPRLEFAALIPKGDYVTLCLLGEDIDRELVQQFTSSEEVKRTLPPNWEPPPDFCRCSPKISVASAVRPYGDRIVFVGDCGTTRLYKDGIGAAYRCAKSAAKTAVFKGVSAEGFRRHYWPVCQTLRRDNAIGHFVFAVTRQIQRRNFARRALWKMVSKEQRSGGERRMSTVLWDTFTGSAPYANVLLRTLHPAFIGRFAWELWSAIRYSGTKPARTS
jgi:flavin-dependent dehydrogenase